MTNSRTNLPHSFTVRIWNEDLGDGKTEWRGKVQSVTSREARYFRDEQLLFAFLREQLAKPLFFQEGDPMSTQENVRFIQSLFASHDPTEFYAENATFHDLSQPAPIQGRAAIGGMMRALYGEIFTETRAEPRGLVASDNAVVAEFVFHGKNTGSLNGAPPTGKVVAVPMIAVYEISGGKIQHARLYYDSTTMARQLGWVK
ncbi:carboxymethylenebutenolidase [Anaerolineae bacterium]|nr:carboxymethylenebutenolidase [Anaerolineae bacterium]